MVDAVTHVLTRINANEVFHPTQVGFTMEVLGMLARRTMVLMLALPLALFALGCGGGQSADEGIAPVDESPPPTEPVVEEPSGDEGVDSQDMGDPVLSDIFYAFDKHNLTSESKQLLEANADQLNASSDTYIIVEGHCDERGTKSYNLALGEKRANAARDYLVSLGVSSARITVISYGKERPFNTGHNDAAWAKNRRAHFVIKN